MTNNPPTGARTSSLAGESHGAYVPKRFGAQGCGRVLHGGRTGLPVGLYLLNNPLSD